MKESLDIIAQRNKADKSSLYHGYAKVYAELFEEWRDEPIRLLEIGVQYGNSIKTWLEYFSRAHIFGLDCWAGSFQEANSRYTFILADQGNPVQMARVAREHGHLDIVIDDGVHKAAQIKTSFDALWPVVKKRGLYIIEDCFCLWDPWFNSEISGPAFLGTFIEAVNWKGKKYYGQPLPPSPPIPLTPLEETLDRVTFCRGLTVLRKKE